MIVNLLSERSIDVIELHRDIFCSNKNVGIDKILQQDKSNVISSGDLLLAMILFAASVLVLVLVLLASNPNPTELELEMNKDNLFLASSLNCSILANFI